jgi:hypothetical protein
MSRDGDIPQSTIDEANRDIVEVVRRYLPLKKSGKNWSACCPFHKEKSPSFSVSPEKGFFYCFGCGAGGDAVRFVMDFEGINFRSAVEKIVGNLGADFSNAPRPKPRESIAYPSSHRADPDKAAFDLERAETVATHPLFSRENTMPRHLVRTIGKCLALPMVNESGEIVNVAAIAPDYRVFWSAGGPSFGAWAAIPAKSEGPRVLCLDYFDGWRLWWKMKGACEVRATVSPDVFIWVTRRMRSAFDVVAVCAEDQEEYRELGLDVVVLPEA